jgi:hypothetical protein
MRHVSFDAKMKVADKNERKKLADDGSGEPCISLNFATAWIHQIRSDKIK